MYSKEKFPTLASQRITGSMMNFFSATDKDEAQRKREEKRLQRQKEIEAKRNSRQGSGGPLKLGAKKMGP